MLIKNQLKFSVRGDKVFPKYIKPDDVKATVLIESLLKVFECSAGMQVKELEDILDQRSDRNDQNVHALKKLMMDRIQVEEQLASGESNRWDWFSLSKEIRLKGCESLGEFQDLVGQKTGIAFDLLSKQLYGDLDDCKKIIKFDPVEPKSLIHRHNISQVQGLLLKATNIKFQVMGRDLIARRQLLQKLKFCQLLAEISESPEQKELTLKVSGPLSIFEQSQSYGTRISQFFPYILLFEKWTVEAEIEIRQKKFQLSLDSNRPMESHYKEFQGYIPEEYQCFVDGFKDLDKNLRKGWTIEEGSAVLNLGAGEYCVPDLTFRNERGILSHLELFHRWNKSQLEKRLSIFKKLREHNLILGISRELAKKQEIAGILNSLGSTDAKIFTFGQFPTTKAILTQLAKA